MLAIPALRGDLPPRPGRCSTRARGGSISPPSSATRSREHARQVLGGLDRDVRVLAFLRSQDPRNPMIEDLLRQVRARRPPPARRHRRRQPQPGAGARVRRRLLRRARGGERGTAARVLESARGDPGRRGAAGDPPAAQDRRLGDRARRGRSGEQRSEPGLRHGAHVPGAGVLRGRAGLAARRRGACRHRRPGDRGAAEGLPARGAGGARPVPAAPRATRSCCSTRRRRRRWRTCSGSIASRSPTTSSSIRRRGSTAASTSRCRSATIARRIRSWRPLEAPPLFSLSRSVNRVSEEIPGTWFTPLLRTSPESWATTDLSIAADGRGRLHGRPGPARPRHRGRGGRVHRAGARRATIRGRAGWSSTATRSSPTTSSSSTSATRTCS